MRELVATTTPTEGSKTYFRLIIYGHTNPANLAKIGLADFEMIDLKEIADKEIHAYIHPFIGPFFGTTRVSRYQKGKTNLDFTEARDSK